MIIVILRILMILGILFILMMIGVTIRDNIRWGKLRAEADKILAQSLKYDLAIQRNYRILGRGEDEAKGEKRILERI